MSPISQMDGCYNMRYINDIATHTTDGCVWPGSGVSSQNPYAKEGSHRFPVGTEKFLTLRHYTLLHNDLQDVCENDP